MCIVYMYVLFFVHEYGDEQSSKFLAPQSRRKENPSTRAKHRILYPRSAIKQTITAPDTTADSTNPRTAEEKAETNQQVLTITLTCDTRNTS